jgi:hypothetical protein
MKPFVNSMNPIKMENSKKPDMENPIKKDKEKDKKEEKEKQDWLTDPDWIEYRAIREEERRNEWSRNSF